MHAIAMEMDEIESHVFSEDELPSMKIYASMHACHKVIKQTIAEPMAKGV